MIPIPINHTGMGNKTSGSIIAGDKILRLNVVRPLHILRVKSNVFSAHT